jgi:hypothetical protein
VGGNNDDDGSELHDFHLVCLGMTGSGMIWSQCYDFLNNIFAEQSGHQKLPISISCQKLNFKKIAFFVFFVCFVCIWRK